MSLLEVPDRSGLGRNQPGDPERKMLVGFVVQKSPTSAGRSVKSSPSMLVTSLPRRGGPWRRSAAKAALVLAKKIEDPVGIQVSQVRYFPGPDVTWHLHNSVEPITLMFGTWIPGRECQDPTLRSVADRTPFVRCGISRSWELVSGSYSGLATGSGRVHEVVQVPRARARPGHAEHLGFPLCTFI